MVDCESAGLGRVFWLVGAVGACPLQFHAVHTKPWRSYAQGAKGATSVRRNARPGPYPTAFPIARYKLILSAGRGMRKDVAVKKSDEVRNTKNRVKYGYNLVGNLCTNSMTGLFANRCGQSSRCRILESKRRNG
jgi:hypothetical protein